MRTDAATTIRRSDDARIFEGYRFHLCQTQYDWERAIAVRRSVYHDLSHYEVAIPDAYDDRSWLLLAEDVATGTAAGTMRMTPRAMGTLEAEEYFMLPRHLRAADAAELTRFAILPEYRKGRTFLPIVSLGLFKLVRELAARSGVRHLVVCSRPERLWTYEWMRFRTTGRKARYAKLADAEHELISLDLARAFDRFQDHPFGRFFHHGRYDEIEVTSRMPRPGVPPPNAGEPVALAEFARRVRRDRRAASARPHAVG